MEIGEKIKVKGVAIVAGVSRNGIKYSKKELEEGSNSLQGVTIIKDHEALTDNSVGKVEKQSMDGNRQLFEGWVEEDGTNLLSKVKDKRVKVSVGAVVNKLVKEDEDSDILTAKGIRYMELSLTPTPGVPDASIEADEGVECEVTESIDLRQLKSKLTEAEIDTIIESIDMKSLENMEENKMAEKTNEITEEEAVETPVETPVEEPVEAPVAEPVETPVETPVEEPVAEPEAPVEEPAEEPAAEATEDTDESAEETEKIKTTLESLEKENLELKERVKKLEEEEKMEENIEVKSKKDVEETYKQFEGYCIAECDDSPKKAFFKMPKSNGEL